MNAPITVARTIDSDAHVLETPYTWEFIEPIHKKYTPMVVTSDEGRAAGTGNVQKEYWVIDNRIQPKEANVGMDTTQSSR